MRRVPASGVVLTCGEACDQYRPVLTYGPHIAVWHTLLAMHPDRALQDAFAATFEQVRFSASQGYAACGAFVMSNGMSATCHDAAYVDALTHVTCWGHCIRRTMLLGRLLKGCPPPPHATGTELHFGRSGTI